MPVDVTEHAGYSNGFEFIALITEGQRIEFGRIYVHIVLQPAV